MNDKATKIKLDDRGVILTLERRVEIKDLKDSGTRVALERELHQIVSDIKAKKARALEIRELLEQIGEAQTKGVIVDERTK